MQVNRKLFSSHEQKTRLCFKGRVLNMTGYHTTRLYGCPYVPWELSGAIPRGSGGTDTAESSMLQQGHC